MELTTVQNLDAMTPAERDAAFDASIVLDPGTLTARQRALLDAQDAEVRALARKAS